YDGATKLGDTTVTQGSITIAAKALAVGTHSLTLKYLGNGSYTASQGSVSVTVVKASSSVSGTAADITWGNAGSVTVTVTPSAATGTVELFDGATKLGEGNLTSGTTLIAIPSRALAVGTHALTLKYLGDGSHSSSQGTMSVTVVKASSSVSGTAADITWGNAGSVSVTVTPSAATGKVELYDGATKLGEGTLTGGATSIAVAARALAVGDHSLTLKYVGDGSYNASQGTVKVVVLKAPTTVSAPNVTLQWAKASSVSITVAPPAGGTVELYDGSTKLGEATLRGDGTARIALPAKSLEVGTHSLTLKYLGSGSYLPSQSTVTVTVTKGRSKVEVSVPKSVDAGDRAKIKATVDSAAGDATGPVEILVKQVGGSFKKELTRKVGDGTVVVKIRLPRSGKYVVKVKYLGDVHTLGDHVSTRLRVS
ncbi:Ig-like domain-containing protein, partial [Nocardioides zhouii]